MAAVTFNGIWNYLDNSYIGIGLQGAGIKIIFSSQQYPVEWIGIFSLPDGHSNVQTIIYVSLGPFHAFGNQLSSVKDGNGIGSGNWKWNWKLEMVVKKEMIVK